MPKEYCFRYPNVEEGGDIEVGQEIEFGHGLVEDEGMFLADYSSGEKEIIAIECSLKELETGEWTEMARIRTFPAVNIFTGDTSGVLVDASEFPEAEEDFELDLSFSKRRKETFLRFY